MAYDREKGYPLAR